MNDLIDKIEQIQCMRLKDGDIIVISVDNNKYSDEDIYNLYYHFFKTLKSYGYENKIMIKPKDVDLNILRKEDIFNE